MKPLSVTDKDTVGIAVQHSDLPMVQFLINGEPLHEHAVNRFRGQVYPSISLPTGEDTKGTKVTLVLDENKFREMSPPRSVRSRHCGPEHHIVATIVVTATSQYQQ